MKKSTQGEAPPSSSRFKALEALAREQIQHWLQRMLEEELTAFLGRPKSERRTEVDAKPGYRNGHGKERRLATSMGTVRVRRPRARGSEEPLESKVRHTQLVQSALWLVTGSVTQGLDVACCFSHWEARSASALRSTRLQ